MTTLRQIFKKSKKAYDLTEKSIKDNYPKVKENLKEKAKETTDQILDADLEETAKKTLKTSGKIAKDASWGLLKILTYGALIGIIVFILYVLIRVFIFDS
jgi:ferritin-like metal-binding protein YciE